jgi:hypothetical protein
MAVCDERVIKIRDNTMFMVFFAFWKSHVILDAKNILQTGAKLCHNFITVLQFQLLNIDIRKKTADKDKIRRQYTIAAPLHFNIQQF